MLSLVPERKGLINSNLVAMELYIKSSSMHVHDLATESEI